MKRKVQCTIPVHQRGGAGGPNSRLAAAAIPLRKFCRKSKVWACAIFVENSDYARRQSDEIKNSELGRRISQTLRKPHRTSIYYSPWHTAVLKRNSRPLAGCLLAS